MSDGGRGFAPELLPHAFERFRRGDGHSGSGLGLAIARSVAVARGGDAEAHNRPRAAGGGSLVRLWLPTQ